MFLKVEVDTWPQFKHWFCECCRCCDGHSHCLQWFAESHKETVFCSCRRGTKVFLFTALKVSASPKTSDNWVVPFTKELLCCPPQGSPSLILPPSLLSLSLSPAGQCISRFTNRKVPYCVKFNPDEDKQNLLVAGMSDKKIVQVKSIHLPLHGIVSLPPIGWVHNNSIVANRVKLNLFLLLHCCVFILLCMCTAAGFSGCQVWCTSLTVH